MQSGSIVAGGLATRLKGLVPALQDEVASGTPPTPCSAIRKSSTRCIELGGRREQAGAWKACSIASPPIGKKAKLSAGKFARRSPTHGGSGDRAGGHRLSPLGWCPSLNWSSRALGSPTPSPGWPSPFPSGSGPLLVVMVGLIGSGTDYAMPMASPRPSAMDGSFPPSCARVDS